MALLKSMRDTGEKIRGHRMDMTNATFIFQGQNLTLTGIYKIYFVCTEIRIIICRLLTNKNTGI